MRVNQLDGEIAVIEERNSKDKHKNGKLVQEHDESKGYTELGRNSQVIKGLTRERCHIHEDYTDYKKTLHQKGSQVETMMEGEPNAKEDTWMEFPRNDTEHYNIMSSTETVVSSNDSVEDMYEKNYKYFAVRKYSLSEDSPGSASDWRHNLKLDRIRCNQNDVFQEDRRIVSLPKPYRRSEPLNGKGLTEENALTNDAKEEKRKQNDHAVYLPNRVYPGRSNEEVLEKNSVSDFNPLVHVSTMHYYYNPCGKQNCRDNHFSFDNPYDIQNGSFRYVCHPFCQPHVTRCLHPGDRIGQNEGNSYMNKKCSLEFDNYLKDMYFTNRSYMEAELRKKCSHYFLPLRRPFLEGGSKRGTVASGSLLRKRESCSSGRLGDDLVDPLKGRTHPHGAKHENNSHNISIGHKCKEEKYHRRKYADQENAPCPRKNNLFSQLIKNLKLLGYALFFCFFISNENKAMKEKQNSTRGGKKALPHSSCLKSERRRK
ncbi:conserved Plasmodium protein, unknown function [Plasmodium knowlesi strain H]|uniref:Uncharacterized protein n=3 Tax=Plasmodium knowlesi TaxID=5850 RepID=A0A5K1VEU4_PLAKH|nr:conserved Plasmodium protein, unknown function [Plasmodium knowlesi strain H]OTN66625.1 Uncharacterized protein PKNOH_S08481900 [Plasmodium knowlesi]CAA9990143.1 conserved Plasmodium protein, unknown function [Plasmodium knowlesi strain H]SBO25831.1 conserved Plasmodium protein, unknown function [Plasmodium knowlesi strain H]SBO28616.1 conserved Plasmodium protein, unknown function [Plasmodium knowlesi strain H]VVS79617.1 conserved Plasmodium protein, unknown function [Plasmodium knowlesi s|eukprot:XP_002260610.1 hypothetical protein, conserved in Plasmodium species [Plasmodium knowlesi strain H]